MKFKDYINNNQQYIKEVKKLGYRNPFNPREIVINNNSTVELSIFDNMVHIKSIRSFDTQKGIGTKTMQILIDLADKLKVNLSLYPKPYSQEKSLSKEKLIQFYNKFGFNMDGEDMIRYHQ